MGVRYNKTESNCRSTLEPKVESYRDKMLEVESLEAKLSKSKAAKDLAIAVAELKAIESDILDTGASHRLPDDLSLEVQVVGGMGVLFPPPKKREINDKQELINILGQDTYNNLSNVTLKDIDNHLNLAERTRVLVETRKGSRKFKFKPLK